jgi:hypothetical protein
MNGREFLARCVAVAGAGFLVDAKSAQIRSKVVRMKRLLAVSSALTTMLIGDNATATAADTELFAEARIQLEIPQQPSPSFSLSDPPPGRHLNLPVMPIDIDYGIPVRQQNFRDSRANSLDAPGPAYRQPRGGYKLDWRIIL